MQSRTLPHLVAYDVSSPKRLQRINRLLKGWGVPVQYSVFLCPLTARSKALLIDEIENIMDMKYDDVRIYPLPKKPWHHQTGAGSGGSQLFGMVDGGLLMNMGSQDEDG